MFNQLVPISVQLVINSYKKKLTLSFSSKLCRKTLTWQRELSFRFSPREKKTFLWSTASTLFLVLKYLKVFHTFLGGLDVKGETHYIHTECKEIQNFQNPRIYQWRLLRTVWKMTINLLKLNKPMIRLRLSVSQSVSYGNWDPCLNADVQWGDRREWSHQDK